MVRTQRLRCRSTPYHVPPGGAGSTLPNNLTLATPVGRVAAADTFVAYQPILEDAILPQANDLFRAMKELAEY